MLPVPDAIENCGLRKVGMRRSVTDAAVWEIYVSAHNYGTVARTVTVSLDLGPPDAAELPPGGRGIQPRPAACRAAMPKPALNTAPLPPECWA